MAKKSAKAAKPKIETVEDSPAISGSQAIREVISQGITKPQEIIEAVKRLYQIEVKPALVNNVKSKLKKDSGEAPTRRKAISSAASANGVEVGNGARIGAAVQFVRDCGSLAAARSALGELEALKGIL